MTDMAIANYTQRLEPGDVIKVNGDFYSVKKHGEIRVGDLYYVPYIGNVEVREDADYGMFPSEKVGMPLRRIFISDLQRRIVSHLESGSGHIRLKDLPEICGTGNLALGPVCRLLQDKGLVTMNKGKRGFLVVKLSYRYKIK